MLAEPLSITAMGMATSLGNARTACAAARAGMSRPRPLDFAVEDLESRAMVPVHGHGLGPLTAGFGEVGLMVRLAALALTDLIESIPERDELARRLAVAVNLPSGFYFRQLDELRAGLDTEAGRQPPLPSVDEPSSSLAGFELTQPLYEHGLIDKVFRAAGLAAPPPALRAVFFRDQPGVGHTIDAARRWLDRGEADACIVLGVDSLLEPRWLRAFAELGILHTPQVPVGLTPGEAAACVLLERRSAPLKGRALGLISGCALDRESGHRFSGTPAVGRALGRAVQSCVKQAGQVDAGLGAASSHSATVVSDMNGDPFRATDFGAALVQLTGVLEPAATLFPALQLGDTRAASGFIGICMALCAFERNYAPSASYIVCAAADAGERAAVAISASAWKV